LQRRKNGMGKQGKPVSKWLKWYYIAAYFVAAAAVVGVFLSLISPRDGAHVQGSRTATVTDSSNVTIHQGDTYNIGDNVVINNNDELAQRLNETVKNSYTTDATDKPKIRVGDSGNWVYPEQGKTYTYDFPNGAKANYFFDGVTVFVEYVSAEGMSYGYYEVSPERERTHARLPHRLEEYNVVIPEKLELERKETLLPKGFVKIHVKLKWGRTVDMILDADSKLRQFSSKGSRPKVNVNNKDRVITFIDPFS
jgi:hypothetical protein